MGGESGWAERCANCGGGIVVIMYFIHRLYTLRRNKKRGKQRLSASRSDFRSPFCCPPPALSFQLPGRLSHSITPMSSMAAVVKTNSN